MEQTSVDSQVVVALRKCGHHLHHNANRASGVTDEALLSALTEDEKKTLYDLLEKCLQSWSE